MGSALMVVSISNAIVIAVSIMIRSSSSSCCSCSSSSSNIIIIIIIIIGTNGVSTNGFTADFMCFGKGTFWVLPLTYFYLPKSARAHLFPPNLSNLITSAVAPLVLTQIRPQPKGWPPPASQIQLAVLDK